ncbi:DNA repair protein RecO [Metamycoplasma phocicerebrale]|nr:DNA repair protein RecO [Metamycoplasma phocicerebrale]
MNLKEYETLGIVLDIKNTKENDGLVKVLLPNSIEYLYARGIQKAESKNRANLQILSLVNLEIINPKISTGIKTLKRATIIKSFPFNEILQDQYNTVKYFLNKQLRSNQLNSFMNFYLECLDNIEKYPNHTIDLFLLKIIEINGLKPIFNKCVECSNTENIIDFEFYKGGFLCSNHSKNNKSVEILRSLYWLNQGFNPFIKNVKDLEAKTIKIMLLDYLKNII